MQSFESFLSLKLPQWDSTGSDLISVIHASFNFWTRHVGLDRRFQTAVDVEERTVGGEHFKLGFRWAGAPSYTKITPRRDPDLSSPVRGSYRNAQHSFRQQLLRKTHASQLMSDLPWSQASVIIAGRTLDGTPSLSAAVYRDLWSSKRCSRIRQDEHRGALRHGS